MFAAYDVSSRQSYITRTNLIPTSWLVINSNKLTDRKSELYVLIALVSQSVSQFVWNNNTISCGADWPCKDVLCSLHYYRDQHCTVHSTVATVQICTIISTTHHHLTQPQYKPMLGRVQAQLSGRIRIFISNFYSVIRTAPFPAQLSQLVGI